jgi:hypothetical protein
VTALAGWQNPRWSEITDPIFRHIFQSLEEWTRNPTVSTISTPRTSAGNEPTYNAVTDRVDQPSPVTLFGNQLIEGEIQSANFVAGTTGWRIRNNGDAEFNSVTVRGDLRAGTVPSGFLSGLSRFEAISTGTTIREGTLHLVNTAAAGVALDFTFATSGPTYTLVADIAASASGAFFRAKNNLAVGLANDDNTYSVTVENAKTTILTNTTESGPLVGYRGTQGRCWIESDNPVVTTSADQATVTFPTAFPAAPKVVVCNGDAAAGGGEVFSVVSVAAGSFVVNCAGAGAANRRVAYIATYAA